MKSSVACAAIVAAIFLLSACATHGIKGSGAAKSETVTLPAGSFDKISISAPADARITIGGAPALHVEGYANVLQLLRSEVAHNTLRIYIEDEADLSTDKDIKMDISLPALTGLELSGAGKVSVDNAVTAQDFSLRSAGAGTVSFADLRVQSFKADMSGAADLALKGGTIGEGNFKISGSGNLSAFGVTQQAASISISGAGSAEVTAASRLDAAISGAGTVRYKGHPAVTRNISGIGSVQEAN